jgi:hypothetical protein
MVGSNLCVLPPLQNSVFPEVESEPSGSTESAHSELFIAMEKLLADIKADHDNSELSPLLKNRALSNNENLDQLIKWRSANPIEYKTTIKVIAEASGLTATDIIKQINVRAKERGIYDDKKESGSDRLVKLVVGSGAELWHTPKQEFYVTCNRDGHEETHPLRTKSAKLWMGSLFYADREKPPSNQAYQDAFTVLEGIALFEGPEREAYVRVGPYEDKIYVDLGDKTWRVIEISKDGWKVIDKSPIRFWRPKTLLPLPEPKKGGKWDDLRKLMNVKDDRNWILAIGWAVQAYWPYGPYAHHNFNGEQGTGKTLAQIILKLLLDPSSTPLRRPPRDDRDVIIAATNERLPSFDNLSGMPEHLSDVFCGLSTGVQRGTRALYTDNEEAVMGAKAPAMMNGIDTLSDRGDLLDRTIINDLPRIKKEDRVREKKIMADFEKVRPQSLGLFLDATATGLKRMKDIDDSDIELPRMADFCAWVMACEPSLPWNEGQFMTTYNQSIEDALTVIVDNDQVSRAVYDLALFYSQNGAKDGFSGNATELLELLGTREHIDPINTPRGWPRTANYLSARLRRMAPALRSRNVVIEWDYSAQGKLIQISMTTAGIKAEAE